PCVKPAPAGSTSYELRAPGTAVDRNVARRQYRGAYARSSRSERPAPSGVLVGPRPVRTAPNRLNDPNDPNDRKDSNAPHLLHRTAAGRLLPHARAARP